jgi:quinol monooxygenase YgiN
MYGLIGRMLAYPEKRDELVAVMLDGMTEMPGCLSYVIATDPANDDAIWITEVWTDAGAHQASLGLEQVQVTIGKARPLIAGMDSRVECEPVGGIGFGSG